MSRHRGIALTALGFVTLAACSGPGQVNPTPPNTTTPTPLSTETRQPDVVVSRPKHVDENTPCQEVITAADVSAATGATATPGISAPFYCLYTLTNTEGSNRGRLTVSFFRDRTIAPTDTITTLAGNSAVEMRNGYVKCTFYVVIDSQKKLGAKGEALSVTADLRDDVDPCSVARKLVEIGFARLPDA